MIIATKRSNFGPATGSATGVAAIAIALAFFSLARGQTLAPKSFPIPQGARGMVIDQDKQEIRFQTNEPIKKTAAFYKTKLEAQGWQAGFDQVASIFANVYYKKAGKSIKIKAKKEDIFKSAVTFTITGDGFAWSGKPALADTTSADTTPTPVKRSLPQPAAKTKSNKTSVTPPGGIDDSDFPLLSAQSTSRDGGMEIIAFNSRKGVAENVAFFTESLKAKGWSKTVEQDRGVVKSLRFEKRGLYIRIAIWPHKFSDNSGTHMGIKGAAEGTGIIWSDSEPSGNAVARQVKSAERYLGPFSTEKRETLRFLMHEKRESAFWPMGDVPASVLATLPGSAVARKAAQRRAQTRSQANPPSARPVKPTEKPPATPITKAKAASPARTNPATNTLKGSITVNRKTYELKYGVAFEGHWFDDKVPFVLLAEKPISIEKLKAAVAKGFDEQQFFFLRQGRYLLLQCSQPEKPSISGWADNLSFGTIKNLVTDVKLDGQRITGIVRTTKSQKLKPFVYSYEADFNLPVTKLK